MLSFGPIFLIKPNKVQSTNITISKRSYNHSTYFLNFVKIFFGFPSANIKDQICKYCYNYIDWCNQFFITNKDQVTHRTIKPAFSKLIFHDQDHMVLL